MPQGHGAAVDVGLGQIQTQFLDAGQRLDGKCLVQLNEIDVADGHSSPL
jgi:hypothetical protein